MKMQEHVSLTAFIVALVGLSLVGSALRADVPFSLSQPVNTPPAPGNGGLVYELPSSLAGTGEAEQAQPGALVTAEVVVGGEGSYTRREQALCGSDVRFSTVNPGDGVAAQDEDVVCIDTLSNSQMDVEEHGDGTATIWDWAILCQQIYYDDRPGYYVSPSYSLVMVDDSDPSCVNSYDYDAFGQAFVVPSGLLTVTVTYSRLYESANGDDTAYGNLYTLDSEGSLDELVVWWEIGVSPTGWSNRYAQITDPATLAELSGKSLVLLFEMFGNMASSNEVIWLDDAQVNVCYSLGANEVYLPLTVRSTLSSLCCVPREPDSKDERGSTKVDCACEGSFSATDTKDYYSLELNGATNVRLWLRNLPSGTNWGAAIFEDAGGSYPRVCYIGTPGSQDKYVDCSGLSAGKSYFVMVDAGTAPGSTKTYQLYVESR